METTAKQFRALAERRFREINPGVPVVIEWGFTSRGFVPDRTGAGATRHGHFTATAEGHRPRLVIATMGKGSKDVTLR